jgi:DNA-binding transcriptional MocR family regulator
VDTEVCAQIVDALEDDSRRQPSIVVTTDDGRSARRIAATIGRLVSAGTLEVGTRLPTVRELSRRLGVSPTTVSEAWRRLADVGAIETRGRNGTFVRHPTGPGGPRRYRQITEGPGHFALDLSSGTPDPELLPDLSPIVATVSRQSLTSSYLDHPVLPALEDELRATWPFPPEALTVVDGALDALDRVAGVALRLGDRVVVEHPGFPPMLDLLERLACDVIGVDVDDEGLDVAQLRAVLDAGPAAAVILQPRAQNPAGVALSPRRAEAIADAVRPARATLVVEDDHANEISSAPLVSVGAWLPERTVHIRSFSKSHGPDLRLAAVGGAGAVVSAVENRRLLGPGWSSRILQSVLLGLIRHPATADTLDVARAAYAERRREASRVLVDSGVEVTGTDGINLWMAVEDERAAVVALAAQGIGVAPGTPFLVRPDSDHLRTTVGVLSPERGLARVAGQLAAAAMLGGPRRRPNR